MMIFLKNDIYLSLNVNRIISKIHNNYILLFIVTICNDDKFMLIDNFYQLLMKKIDTIENININAFDDD